MGQYFSVDVELTGSDAQKHSMIALGACVVGNLDKQFYREMKPLSWTYEFGAMKAATKGLNCIPKNVRDKEGYNPHMRGFRPEYILRLLMKQGSSFLTTMSEFSRWIQENSMSNNAIIVAKPVTVDVPFTRAYFEKSSLTWPFTDQEDLESAYRELIQNKNASIKELGLLDVRQTEHNALEDALFQAEQFEKILQLRKELSLKE